MPFKFEGYQEPEDESFKFEGFQEQPSKGRSVASSAAKGLIRGTKDVLSLTPFGNLGPIPEDLEEEVIERQLPTRDETAEKVVHRAARLIPSAAIGPEGILAKLLQLGAGTLAGHLAESEGLGETAQGISEAIGMGLSGISRSALKKGLGSLKGQKPPIERMASGLSKARAVESRFAEKGVISPERQEKVISALNKEASDLAKSSLEKSRPIAKRIQEGFDFESDFQKGFGDLAKSAEKANPSIDITPISKFLSQTHSKYKGIPTLHPEGKSVLREVKALYNNPQTSLRNLLKIYRSNNQKVKNIYETSRMTGKQQEYVDFLVDLNKNIVKSFERTLPADSAWMKQFKDLNSQYGQYKNATKALGQIQSILEQRATPANLQKFSTDPKLKQKLQLSLGREAADEISQIAKDLKSAQEAIKRIPVKELSTLDKILPFAVLFPGHHVAGLALSGRKYLDWLRRGWGILLTSPAKRRAFDGLLKAIIEKSPSAYQKAAVEFEKALKED
jgi:hypothetical protein